MTEDPKPKWLRDAEAEQSSDFDGPAQDEGGFGQTILYNSLTLAEWLGFLVLLIFFGGFVAFLLLMSWPASDAPWWKKALGTYGIPSIFVVLFVGWILWGNRKAGCSPGPNDQPHT